MRDDGDRRTKPESKHPIQKKQNKANEFCEIVLDYVIAVFCVGYCAYMCFMGFL